MKRIFYILTFIFFGLFGIVENGYGDTYNFLNPPSVTELPGSWSTSGGSKTINNISWTYSSATYLAIDNTHTKIQIGSQNSPQTRNWTIQTAISSFGVNKKITSISITAYTTRTSATYDISVGGTSVKSGSLSTSSSTYTVNNLDISSGDIIVTLKGSSSSRAMYLSNISITYENTSSSLYTINFLNDNGVNPNSITQTSIDEELTLPNISPSNACRLNNWSFAGWAITRDNSTTYTNFTPTKDTVLYAVYKRMSDTNYDYVIDTLTNQLIGNGGTSYNSFDNITQTSSAIYAGQSAGGTNESGPTIQLRSKNSNSGIINTNPGGLLNDIHVKWNNATVDGRTLKIYTSDTVYHSPEDLYNYARCFDSIVKGTSNSLILNKRPYMGIRSKENALYIDSIFITWLIPTYDYLSNPLCFSTDINVAEWFKDSVKFDVGDYDSIHTYRGDLENKSCDSIRIELTKNDSSCIRWFHVPIFAEGSMSVGPECDVVVLGGKTFTPRDGAHSKGVYVYPGGTLIVNDTYTVDSLVLRKDSTRVPYFSNNGTLATNKLYFEMYTNGDDWRWITLPDTLTAGEIKNSSDISLGWYDGLTRAQYGRGGWKTPETSKVFNPGEGFIFGIDNDRQKLYKYQLNKNILDILEYEIPVTDFGYNLNPKPPTNDLGWNLIGNPFLDIYQTDWVSSIKVGKLMRDTVDPWNGKWIVDPSTLTNQRYIVERCYDDDADVIAAGHYKSILLSDGYEIKPFTSFFVQVAEGCEVIVFTKDKTISRVPSKFGKVSTNNETFLRVNIGNRKTGCFISDIYSDEYEANADLESLYPIYQLINGYKLLYSAISDSIINAGVHVYTPAGNLHLDEKTDVNEFDEINALYNGNWYDLLHGETVDVSGEFILQAKRKTQNTATDLDESNTNTIFDKYIHNGNIYIRKNNCIFTVLGEIVK